MYDALYASKDYETECDRLEAAFKVATRQVHSVIDLGCGTGNHTIPLARRGYTVVGVDRSPGMLERARRKARLAKETRSEFVLGDIRDVRLTQKFDACILMFAVLGYQATNEDVAAALANVRYHLHQGGIFAFDVWNGAAVLAVGPSERRRTVLDGERRLIRFSGGKLDLRHNLCHVDATHLLVEGTQIVSEVQETHTMRYFFPLELELFLDHAGFDVAEVTSFDNPGKEIDSDSWNMFVVARRR